MDKIKNILSSDSSKQTDESGDFTNKNKVAGEGSHFGATTGPDSTQTSSTTDPTTKMPGAFEDDAATTASVASGIAGKPQSGTPLTATETDTQEPNLASKSVETQETAPIGTAVTVGSGTDAPPYHTKIGEKIDPHVPSNTEGSKTLDENPSTGTGIPVTDTTTTSPPTDKTTDSYVGQDTAAAAGTGAVGAGVASTNREPDEADPLGVGSGRSFPLAGNSGASTASGAPNDYAPGQIGTYPAGVPPTTSTTTAGPHTSDLANKADPRVDSDADGSRTIGTTAATAPSADKHPSDTNTGVAAGVTGGAAAGTALASEPDKQETSDPLDDKIESKIGPDTTSGYTGTGPVPAETGQITRSGPVSLSEPADSSRPQYDDAKGDTVLATSAGATGVAAYETSTLDPRSPETGPAPNTAGPHKSDLLNKLDPRVDSDLSKQKKADDSTAESHKTGPVEDEDHVKRKAAILGVGGLGTAGAYEAGKPDNQPETTGTINTTEQVVQPSVTQGPNQPIADSTTQAPLTQEERPPVVSEETREPQEDHTGRDAVLAGGAGATVGAVAGHEMSEKEAEKEAKKLEKEHEKEVKAIEKEHEKEQKAAEKEHAKAQKEHEKEVAKEHKAQEKAAAKEQKAIEKEHEKEQKAVEKEQAKELKAIEKQEEKERKEHEKAVAEEQKALEKEDSKEEKKHKGILGIFKRDKSDEEFKEEEAERKAVPESLDGTRDHSHVAEGTAIGAGAMGAGAGVAAAESGDHGPPATQGDRVTSSSGDAVSQAALQDSAISSGSNIAGPAGTPKPGLGESSTQSGTATSAVPVTTGQPESQNPIDDKTTPAVVGAGGYDSTTTTTKAQDPYTAPTRGDDTSTVPPFKAEPDYTTTSTNDTARDTVGTNTTTTTQTTTDTIPPKSQEPATSSFDQTRADTTNTTADGSGSGSGSGIGPTTTHDAYGPADPGRNKLHKDPPQKVLEERGLAP